ncbi:MAG: hypothetical protein NTV70_07120 [Acidobacteria bacterium]|nr:hypothetical protein [Acidobacteriota bacterium]
MSLSVNGKPVDWDGTAMEQLRLRVMEAYEAQSPIGGEIAGILYGRASNTRWRILAWRELPREDPSRPAVPLPPGELAVAKGMVSDWMSDLDLRTLKPIGWFRSRTRGMAALSPEDGEACEAIFGKKGALALILRPSTQRPVAAALIHYRPGPPQSAPDPAGPDRAASNRGVQFELMAPELEKLDIQVPPATVASDTVPTASSPHVPLVPPSTGAARSRWMVIRSAVPRVAAFLAAVAAVAGATFLALDRPVRLAVDYTDARSVTVSWNPSVGFLSGATGVELRINGIDYELPLDRLRSGRHEFPRPQGDLRVGFRLRGEYASAQRGTVTVVVPPAKKSDSSKNN